jgi:hypothetical protein
MKILKKAFNLLLCLLLTVVMLHPNVSRIDAETSFDSGLLENGSFADVVEGYTGNYNKAEDNKAAAWQYWTNTKEAKTELIENGIKIEALSKTNGSAERVTIQQTVTGLEAGKKYKLSGKYEVISTASGSFSIDVNGVTTIASHTSKTDGEQTFEAEFTATGTSHQIRIVVSNGAELTATVKEFKLEEVIEDNLDKSAFHEESSGLISRYISKQLSGNASTNGDDDD